LLDLNVAVRRGFVYPLLLMLIATLLCTFVLRRLSEPMLSLYASLHVEPPRITRLLARLGSPESSLALMIFGAVLTGLILWLVFSTFTQRGIAWERMGWLPGLGGILKNVRAARFAQALSLLVNQGMPLPRALRLVGPLIGSTRAEASVSQLASEMETGQPLDELLARATVLPPLLRWLVAVGQRENGLGATLRDAATYYRQRAAARAEWLSLITPLATVVVIGGGVTLTYGLMLFGPMVELWERLNVK
jgi:general secretion pathway protein F